VVGILIAGILPDYFSGFACVLLFGWNTVVAPSVIRQLFGLFCLIVRNNPQSIRV
jgi:hypothetical protein